MILDSRHGLSIIQYNGGVMETTGVSADMYHKVLDREQRLRQRVAELERVAQDWHQRLLASNRDNARLREVLGMVEWQDYYGELFCPWCNEPKWDGHAPDCPRQRALDKEGG